MLQNRLRLRPAHSERCSVALELETSRLPQFMSLMCIPSCRDKIGIYLAFPEAPDYHRGAFESQRLYVRIVAELWHPKDARPGKL